MRRAKGPRRPKKPAPEGISVLPRRNALGKEEGKLAHTRVRATAENVLINGQELAPQLGHQVPPRGPAQDAGVPRLLSPGDVDSQLGHHSPVQGH
jgi:hypothetical protein